VELTATSPRYLVLLAVAPLLLLLHEHKRKYVFLATSLCVYISACHDPCRLLALGLFVVPPYFYIQLMIHRSRPAWPLLATLILSFICLNGYTWITAPIFGHWEFLSWHILGLSYLLFRQVDIILGVSAGTILRVPALAYLSYLFSFWTILAGPIQRFAEFQAAIESPVFPQTAAESLKHLHRAANGLIKIVLLAAVFKNRSDITGYLPLLHNNWSRLFVIFYCYPAYVYFNFSGYCDVVIGMGRWAGFSIPENFDRPYVSRNMVEFWNRWHITLSQLIRDYLYNPLLKAMLTGPLSGHVNLAQYLCILVTFFLVGVWHGSTINFAVFGLLHAFGMAASMLYRQALVRVLGKTRFKVYSASRAVAVLEWACCMHFVCFTFLFFEYDLAVVSRALLHVFDHGRLSCPAPRI
jgi:D-alanyl-lipoteichoic acid acyltransferase DltB (MBOAT superfamily)